MQGLGENGKLLRAAFVKQRIGSVKAPKQIEIWPELPRSKVGKVLKADVKAKLLAR